MFYTIISMYSLAYFNYYKSGRVIFALSLLMAFQMAELLFAINGLMYVLLIYFFIALFRLIVAPERINYFDFLLDIIFISAVVFVSAGAYPYFTILYLFPIFFSSVLIKTKIIFIFPLFSILLYAAIHYIDGNIVERESFLNIALHLFSFAVIAQAGDNLKRRMEKQERYIKELEEERIKTQSLERLYRVSADLAHELRNPIAAISGAVQFLKEGKVDGEFIQMLDSETKRLTALINDFIMFSRPSDAPAEDVDLSEVVKILILRQSTDRKIVLKTEGNLKIAANRTFIEAAINNILKNAVEAAKSTVHVTLKGNSSPPVNGRLISADNPADKGIILEIEDDGSGIGDEARDRIFEPFFTTKPNGSGLGLAISYRVINSLGGNIFVEKSSLGGAKFTVVFPTLKSNRAAEQQSGS